MSSRTWTVIIIALFQFLVSPGSADASLLGQRLSLPEMVSRSDGIFLGKIVAIQSVRPFERSEISTLVTIEVRSELKGRANPNGRIEVQTLGGSVGNETEIVRGAAQFIADEEVLVFVTARSDGLYDVLGMAQGKYTLRQDTFTGAIQAIHDLNGLYFLAMDPMGRIYRPEEAGREEMLLVDLIDSIERLLFLPIACQAPLR